MYYVRDEIYRWAYTNFSFIPRYCCYAHIRRVKTNCPLVFRYPRTKTTMLSYTLLLVRRRRRRPWTLDAIGKVACVNRTNENFKYVRLCEASNTLHDHNVRRTIQWPVAVRFSKNKTRGVRSTRTVFNIKKKKQKIIGTGSCIARNCSMWHTRHNTKRSSVCFGYFGARRKVAGEGVRHR